jgi:hypothetical protein
MSQGCCIYLGTQKFDIPGGSHPSQVSEALAIRNTFLTYWMPNPES